MTISGLKDQSLFTASCLVGDAWIAAEKGTGIAVTDPADGSLVAEVPSLSVETIRSAIDKAEAAQVEWAKRTAKERASLIRRWYELILENADDLARILTAEQGKPLAEAKGEIVANAAYLEWFAEEAKRVYGDIVPPPGADRRVLVMKQPVGVCAAITRPAVTGSSWPMRCTRSIACVCSTSSRTTIG